MGHSLDWQKRACADRAATAIHQLGPRVLSELLLELGDDALNLATQYASIDPVALAVAGGDRFPPRPLRVIS